MVQNHKGLSVIICCYNSANKLPQTLRHIACQVVSGDVPWELIIVDNNSNDNTAQVAATEWGNYHLNAGFRVVGQKIPGLKYAKEKGIEHSEYDYIIYCDDDNWLSGDYLQTAFEIMSSDESIGIAGGYSEPVFEAEPPAWFDEHKFGYAIGRQAEKSGEISSSVYGAGMVVRKSAWEKLYKCGFRSLLPGRQGSKLSSGEDCELCYGMRLAGYKIYYDERLMFKHFMPESRIRWKKFRRMYRGFGFQNAVLYPYEYFLRNENQGSICLLDWKKRAFETTLRLLADPVNLFKTLIFTGEGDNNILSVERKIGLLMGLLKRRNNYDLSIKQIHDLHESLNDNKL